MEAISLFLPPVLNDDAPVCAPGPDGHCALCADEGVPGQVAALLSDNLAVVDMAGGRQEVALDLVDDAPVGAWVLVHLGFAIARLEGPP